MKLVYILIVCAIPILGSTQTLLPGFARVQVGGPITVPTVLAFAPDGRIFVAQQSGGLRVIKNGTLLPTPFVTVTVDATGERGLIGVTFDPDFPSNQYIYVYYTVPSPGAGIPPFNRISRFTANGDVALIGSEQIILNLDPLSTATNHNGGALAFGPDGKLYVAIGENANGANAQNLNTYHGKLLRINKDGSAPTDNPFYASGTTDQSKRVWAYGLRNPFTFSFQPGTGKLFVNDVGQSTEEEINDATLGGRNFGWPTAEGPSSNPNFVNPVFYYNHSGAAPTGCAITGGAFFNPSFTTYQASYWGKFFFMDYCSNWIYSLDLTGTPTATLFGSNVGGSSVSLSTGPDGNLYYLSRGSNALFKITSTNSTVPIIAQQPSPLSVPAGNPASFTISVSGTLPLQYQWQKDGINIAGANLSTFTINETVLTDAGNYRVIVTNIAGQVTSNAASLSVTPNTKPIAQIDSPTENTMYTAGTTISFSGSGADDEDGMLPASSFSWQINFHHDTHRHDEPPRENITSGSFDIPNQGETSTNVWYRIILTVTDSKGSVAKDSVDVYPQLTTITLATDPPGLIITLDGQPHDSPLSVESVQGMKREIGVNPKQSLNGDDYVFFNWSQGGDSTQILITPEEDAAYTAQFAIILGVEGPQNFVYPNPATDFLNLPGDAAYVRLIDLMGRPMALAIENQNDRSLLDLRSLNRGIYILDFTAAGKRFHCKILLQR